MARLSLCAALAALLACGAQAGENFCGRSAPHPIDQAFDASMQRSGGVTADMRDAQSSAYAAWDKELNRVYAELLKAAGAKRREALRTAQRAWLAFDEAQAKWGWALHGDEGTAAPLNVAGAALERRRSRVCDLEQDLQGLKETGTQ